VDVAAESISPGGIYQFIPNMITASNGTIVSFRFSGIPGNHSVTQSTLVAPCQPLLNGFDSGFIDGKETKAGKFPTWNYTVTNDQSSIWFFCNQQTPSSHCRAGMVGVINGHASGFGNFQAKAEGIALASTASGPSQPTVRPYPTFSSPILANL
ncbi:hypothetical protein B0H13DRAFT_1623919, partial [Mycena leptocephala]